MSQVNNEHEFVTYPRRFLGYKWYKPLLVALLMAIFYSVFSGIIVGISMATSQNPTEFLQNIMAGYDGFDVYTFSGAFASLGTVVVMIPSLFIAAAIVRDRPVSSYTSSRGGWNWKIFGKMLVLAAIVVGIPSTVMGLADGKTGVNRFTVIGFIVLTILGPLQCVAEEYMFRGFIMQTIGSWFKLPVLGLIIQTVIFASFHPYSFWGVVAVAISGFGMGLAIYITKGIEAGAAIHIVNNMVTFYITGFGFGKIQTEVGIQDAIFDIIVYIIYISAILFFRKKGWFDEIKKDDAEDFNQKKMEKIGGKKVQAA